MPEQKANLVIELEVEDRHEAKLVMSALKHASTHSREPKDAADLQRLGNKVRDQAIEHYE